MSVGAFEGYPLKTGAELKVIAHLTSMKQHPQLVPRSDPALAFLGRTAQIGFCPAWHYGAIKTMERVKVYSANLN